jgi:uncharacterized protein (DUF1800 family)
MMVGMSVRPHIAAIRFGYGLRLDEAPPADPEAWLRRQIDRPPAPPEGPSVDEALRARAAQIAMRPAPDTPAARGAGNQAAGRGPAIVLGRAETLGWAGRRLKTDAPFHERLVDFWMNHFTVSRRNGLVSLLPGCLERDAIRPHVHGRFADMLVAATLHPAMIGYLDNANSIGPDSQAGRRRGAGLNENLAREVLELHSLSPAGGYTQGDVGELARILTGHSINLAEAPFGYVWRRATHQPGEKSLLGRRFPEGEQAAEQALRFLGTHPATYRHLAVKLARQFVADAPRPPAVRAVETALRETEGDLKAAYRALIALREAWEPPLGKFRTPIDHVLAACRAAGMFDRPEMAAAGLAGLGQTLWSAPQPNGWADTAEEWAGPEALLRRVDWSYTMAGRLGRVDPGLVAEAALGPLVRAETVSEMRRAGSVRDSLTLLFNCPEFLHR